MKTSQLETLNKRVNTYMKEHQCVCIYEAPLPQQLLFQDGSLHTNKSYYCWSEWEKRDGTKYRCKYESDDEGQMWRHYHMHHLNILCNLCLVETCTYGVLGKKWLGTVSLAAPIESALQYEINKKNKKEKKYK